MIRNLDDAAQVQAYRDDGIDVFKGEGRIDGSGRVTVSVAIKTRTPLSVLRDSVAQFPTFTEAYLKAVERLDC